jgi:hypothetical protein
MAGLGEGLARKAGTQKFVVRDQTRQALGDRPYITLWSESVVSLVDVTASPVDLGCIDALSPQERGVMDRGVETTDAGEEVRKANGRLSHEILVLGPSPRSERFEIVRGVFDT